MKYGITNNAGASLTKQETVPDPNKPGQTMVQNTYLFDTVDAAQAAASDLLRRTPGYGEVFVTTQVKSIKIPIEVSDVK